MTRMRSIDTVVAVALPASLWTAIFGAVASRIADLADDAETEWDPGSRELTEEAMRELSCKALPVLLEAIDHGGKVEEVAGLEPGTIQHCAEEAWSVSGGRPAQIYFDAAHKVVVVVPDGGD